MTKSRIEDYLWGCLEIPLFMSRGAARFEGDKKSALVSFALPFLFLFPTAELAQINPDLAGHDYMWLLSRFFLLFIGSTAIFYACVYGCLVALERKEKFFSLVTAMNWLNITSFVINIPFFLLVYADIYSFQEMYNLFIFMMLFGTTYIAFLITYLLRINWMLGTAIAIMGMLIDDGLHHYIFPS